MRNYFDPFTLKISSTKAPFFIVSARLFFHLYCVAHQFESFWYLHVDLKNWNGGSGRSKCTIWTPIRRSSANTHPALTSEHRLALNDRQTSSPQQSDIFRDGVNGELVFTPHNVVNVAIRHLMHVCLVVNVSRLHQSAELLACIAQVGKA